MDHLTNCHGEWTHLFQALAALSAVGLPGIAAWLRSFTFQEVPCDRD